MLGMRKINNNPAEQRVQHFLAATNAYAEQLRQRGEKTEFLSAANAKEAYGKVIKTAMALANPAHEKHAVAHNALKEQFGNHREALDLLANIGAGYQRDMMKLAEVGVKNGMTPEKAAAYAMNSTMGNPVYDFFSNLNILAGQLFEEQAIVESFLNGGDAFAVPQEAGGTGYAKSRFRLPVEQLTGSAKISQGDINPNGRHDDNNQTQISLYNEFKNASMLDAVFEITQEQREQAMGYAAVVPVVAGFILQNRYFTGAQKQVMKLAELIAAFGSDAAGNYTPNVGGSYGLISSAIQLALSDWNTQTPSVAQASDWQAAPTKLIQKIQNLNFKPVSTSTALPVNLEPSLLYKDIVRLFMLFAQQNVDFGPREWTLFVPTSYYGIAMQYLGTVSGAGNFNRQLQEAVGLAVGDKIVTKINVVPSSLMNYGASNGLGGTNSYNYMAAVAQGCAQEKKPIIMPGQTSIPYIVSENVSAMNMKFRCQYLTGGVMFAHYGGAAILEFSAAA